MNTKALFVGHQAVDRFSQHTGIKAVFSPSKGADQFLDATIKFIDPRFDEVFAVEFKSEVRNHHLPDLLVLKERSKRPFILIGQTIFPSVKEYLRKHKINYVDIAGNTNIQTSQVIIYIDGQKWKDDTHPVQLNRAFTKTGLRVVFLLLTDPGAVNYSTRLLAERAGVSVGAVNNTITGLQTMGFLRRINKSSNRIDLRDLLTERWISGYQERLKPALHLGNFRLASDVHGWEKLRLDAGSYWSGEAAAFLIRKKLIPKVVTIYSGLSKIEFMIKNKLIPDAEGPITLYQRFWNGQLGDIDKHLAPVLLIYADLTDTMDPRCIEEAQELIKENSF
ncbi:type IV toxin-antitoxin system AbiEi family antitoxin [Daejeonella sp.]|uniref:type IV toxin-antitoxin system AbiEi family antitoxin n=1 Tax=Daejeonella sp. TaxID=2805397 RepID=UPI0030BC41E6